MNFLTWGRNPWGQQILTHVSWDLLWASLFAGVMFLVAHASYMVLSAHRKRSEAETDALEAANKNLPEQIERHTFMARAFHWVMAASMFVLLFTAFLPIVGVQLRLGAVALDGRSRADRRRSSITSSTRPSSSTSGRSGSARRTSPSSSPR